MLYLRKAENFGDATIWGHKRPAERADPVPDLDPCGLRMIHLKTAKVLGITTTVPPSLLAASTS